MNITIALETRIFFKDELQTNDMPVNVQCTCECIYKSKLYVWH